MMKKTLPTLTLLLLSQIVWGQGGPPPGNACNTPNPPPWCDTPGVPIDTPILMIGLLIGGIILGYRQYTKKELSNT